MTSPAYNPWIAPDPDVIRFGHMLLGAGRRLVHDVGCGAGRHALALAEAGLHVIASDVTPALVRHVRITLPERIGGVAGSMLAAPLADASLDGVVAFNVAYHNTATDMAVAVKEIFRTLKPDGLAYLTLATPEHGSYGHGREMEPHTFLPPSGVLHHFTGRDEAGVLLRAFDIVEWRQSAVDYVSRNGETIRCVHWRIIARKGASDSPIR